MMNAIIQFELKEVKIIDENSETAWNYFLEVLFVSCFLNVLPIIGFIKNGKFCFAHIPALATEGTTISSLDEFAALRIVFATFSGLKIAIVECLWGHLKFYGTQHFGCGRFQNRPLARLLISSLSLSRVGMFPDLYNRVFEKKRRQLVKKIELDENGLRLVWQEEFLLTTESNIIKLCRVNRQLF